ncbi:MAG: DUF3316 domain-containing protein [Bacteroides sp.]
MKEKILCLLFFAFAAASVVAQNDSLTLSKPFWTVNKTTSIGYGQANVYDTYLSPLEYEGHSYSFLHERVSRIHFFENKLIKQQMFSLNFTGTDNPAKNSSEYSVLLEYRLGAHYPVWQHGNLRVRAGGIWNIGGGAIYNEHNSNNPVSAKAFTNLNLSAQAFFCLKSVLFRWQLDLPVVGVFFMPEYGESYYEISLGNHPNSVHFASFHNQRAIQSYLSADFPVSNWTIRLGLQNTRNQTKANDLTSHIYTNTLMIGLVSESLNLSGKKLKKTKAFKSALED